MPAPVPVNITHDDPSLLIALAAASGQAGYGARQQARADDYARMQYQGQLQRMASNDAFVENELSRRSADTRYRNDYELARQKMAVDAEKDAASDEIQNAYKQAVLAQRIKESEQGARQDVAALEMRQKESDMRMAAQKSSAALRERDRPLTLVPAEGSIEGSRGPTATVRSQDGSETMSYGDGIFASVRAGASDSERALATGKAEAQRATRPEMVPQYVREQMDVVRRMQGSVPPAAYEAMLEAARSGRLKMDQLIDDTRQLIPDVPGSGRMSAMERNTDKYTAEASELTSIGQLPFKDQAAYARRRFGMQDPDLFTDDDAVAALESREVQLKALLKPQTNSNGKTPTGGNPVPVQSIQEAMQLPSGTIFQTPDGRIKRVP